MPDNREEQHQSSGRRGRGEHIAPTTTLETLPMSHSTEDDIGLAPPDPKTDGRPSPNDYLDDDIDDIDNVGDDLDDDIGDDSGPRPPTGLRIVTVPALAPEPELKRASRQRKTGDTGGSDPDRPVGYKNPPRSGQQQAGAPSKNPRGRPKGTPNAGAMIRFLRQKMDVQLSNGQVKRMTRFSALKYQMAERAAGGDRHMSRLAEDVDAAETRLDLLQLEHERKRALEEESWPRTPTLGPTVDKIMGSTKGVIGRLKSMRIIDRAKDDHTSEYTIAEWMLEAIKDREETTNPFPP